MGANLGGDERKRHHMLSHESFLQPHGRRIAVKEYGSPTLWDPGSNGRIKVNGLVEAFGLTAERVGLEAEEIAFCMDLHRK